MGSYGSQIDSNLTMVEAQFLLGQTLHFPKMNFFITKGFMNFFGESRCCYDQEVQLVVPAGMSEDVSESLDLFHLVEWAMWALPWLWDVIKQPGGNVAVHAGAV